MNLLSDNDIDALKNAMLRHQETYMLRTLGDVVVRARTLRAEPPWQVDMIVQIQMEHGNVAWTQNFVDAEDAKRELERCFKRLKGW